MQGVPPQISTLVLYVITAADAGGARASVEFDEMHDSTYSTNIGTMNVGTVLTIPVTLVLTNRWY